MGRDLFFVTKNHDSRKKSHESCFFCSLGMTLSSATTRISYRAIFPDNSCYAMAWGCRNYEITPMYLWGGAPVPAARATAVMRRFLRNARTEKHKNPHCFDPCIIITVGGARCPLRGITVYRTYWYGIYKNLYTSLFLLLITIFGPSFYGPP